MSRHPVLVNQEPALVSCNNSILHIWGVVTGQLAFKSAAAFRSVLCCFPAPWKGVAKGRDAGSLESGRKQGIATPLLPLGASPAAAASSLWPRLPSTAPSSSGSVGSPPRALASIGCPDFWLWKNYLVLSLQPQGSSSSLLLPASGLRHHFLLASQPFYHLGSQFPLLSSLCLKDVYWFLVSN